MPNSWRCLSHDHREAQDHSRRDLGHDELHLSTESAALVEANLHNAVELVLARFYRLP